METQQKIDLLWDRFVHRDDTYAEQWYDKERGGGYNRKKFGKCQHAPPCRERGRDCPDIRYVSLTKDTLIQHVKGERTVGTYALDTNNTVKWLCLDMDIRKGQDGDVRDLTLKVATFIAEHLPKTSFLVENSGNRGYHIWIFFAEPIEGTKAYTLGQWIRSHIEHPPEVGIEIYPKQHSITRTGNPVKIPLGIHQKTGNRCMFIRGNFTEHEDQWAALQNVVPLAASDVDQLLTAHDIRVVEPELPDVEPSSRGMICMTRLMSEGIEEGSRDVGFFKLAVYLKDRGLPYENAVAAMEATNRRCQPPFDDLEGKALSAYASDYSPFPCFDPAFDSYCSSKCPFYARKVRDRGFGREEIIKRLSRD